LPKCRAVASNSSRHGAKSLRILQEKPPGWFDRAKRLASIIENVDGLDYDLSNGEFNPAIVECFVSEHVEPGTTLWEPFAGHSCKNKTIEICQKYGVRLIAYDIAPVDSRVKKANSTAVFPDNPIGGLIFHPPYLTSPAMSFEKGELSTCSQADYIDGLRRTAKIADNHMLREGKICIVGRTIRSIDRTIHLEWLFSKLFLDPGYKFVRMYSSVPDWVVILEKSHG
jgi:hypothetical protein